MRNKNDYWLAVPVVFETTSFGSKPNILPLDEGTVKGLRGVGLDLDTRITKRAITKRHPNTDPIAIGLAMICIVVMLSLLAEHVGLLNCLSLYLVNSILRVNINLHFI